MHVAYLHTPMRYAWDQAPEYFHPARMGRAGRMAAPLVTTWLRTWDVASNASLAALRERLADTPVELVIENDQTRAGI